MQEAIIAILNDFWLIALIAAGLCIKSFRKWACLLLAIKTMMVLKGGLQKGLIVMVAIVAIVELFKSVKK